jgi:hypothetical protein
VRTDDRRAAMTELQSLVAESRQAQLAFGAIGLHFLYLLFDDFFILFTYNEQSLLNY